jgi:hypothetical protein
MRDERSPAFEHQRDVMFRGVSARDALTVGFDFSDGFADQPRHFARVRCQHDRPAMAVKRVFVLRDGVQAIGVQHHGDRLLLCSA